MQMQVLRPLWLGVLSSLLIIVVSLYFTGFFQDLPFLASPDFALQRLSSPYGNWWTLNPSSKHGSIPKQMVSRCGLPFLVLSVSIFHLGLSLVCISTFILLLWRISRPHIAVIGLVEGDEHFRNVERHQVQTTAQLLSMRIDESLTFLNANILKGELINAVSQQPELAHVVINCSSVSSIDLRCFRNAGRY